MVVNVNMCKDVYDYFHGYDKSAVADTLLEMFDFTNLPPTSGRRDKEVKVNISNDAYISLYNTVGPRSKMVSLGRLFEYAMTVDVLSLDRFKLFKVDEKSPIPTLVTRAYKALLEAQKYDKSDGLKELTQIVYRYKKVAEEKYDNK